MRKGITQEFEFGCGIACYAFALDITYKQAVVDLGPKQASSTRFWIKDLKKALNDAGRRYRTFHVNPRRRAISYKEGTIVLIRRSELYPFGHYLIRDDSVWMDPWINLASNKNIIEATSGFRKRLPGKPMYMLVPEN